MTVAIIGTGLIGGSMALAIKEKMIVTEIIGVESNSLHQEIALQRGLVNRFEKLETAVKSASLIILAVPVNVAIELLPAILDLSADKIVIDTGSTKQAILKSASLHPFRSRFVATHPMWGTEYSGPGAAMVRSFTGKAVVICEAGKSDPEVLESVETLYGKLGMHLVYMTGEEHDLHVAYVSHISHITSFALANTVLEKEKEEDAIFELASGGFESTVRLAKSNPETWAAIFDQNRENVLDVLNEHITQLRKFKSCLEKENYAYLIELMKNANRITRIIDEGSVKDKNKPEI